MKETTQTMIVKKLRPARAPKPNTKARVAVVQGWNAFQPCTGKAMVANLEGVKKNYAAQAKADRRAAALDRRAGL